MQEQLQFDKGVNEKRLKWKITALCLLWLGFGCALAYAQVNLQGVGWNMTTARLMYMNSTTRVWTNVPAAGVGAAASTEPFVTAALTAGLSAERNLAAGTYTTVTDNGANASITVNCQDASGVVGGCVSTGVQTLAGSKTLGGATTTISGTLDVTGAGGIINSAADVLINDGLDLRGDLYDGLGPVDVNDDIQTAGFVWRGASVGPACGAGIYCIQDSAAVSDTLAVVSTAQFQSSVDAWGSITDSGALVDACPTAGAVCISDATGFEVTTGTRTAFLRTAGNPDVDIDGDLDVGQTLDVTGTATFSGAINDGAGTGTTTQVLHGGASVAWGAVVAADLSAGTCAAASAVTALAGALTCDANVAFDDEANTFTANQTIGTTSTGRTLTVNAASTGSIQEILTLRHTDTDSVGETNQGVQIGFNLEDGASNDDRAASITGQWVVATSGDEQGAIVFRARQNGTADTEIAQIVGQTSASSGLSGLQMTQGGIWFNGTGTFTNSPPANYVLLYTREDISCGGGGAADCCLRARVSTGAEVTVAVVVTDAGCP